MTLGEEVKKHKFRPGDKISISGLYSVVHANACVDEHLSLVTKGFTFPFCKTCGNNVEYMLLQEAELVSRDERFIPN